MRDELRQVAECLAEFVQQHEKPEGPDGTAHTQAECCEWDCYDCKTAERARAALALPAVQAALAGEGTGERASGETEFLRGMLAALAVVAVHDQETIFREIVDSAGATALLRACEGEEDREWSGLKRYGYRLRKPRAAPPAPASTEPGA